MSDKNHLVGTAHFSQPHAERKIVARLVKDGTLQLETFTNFNDASGRENYSQVEVFKRVSEAQPAP